MVRGYDQESIKGGLEVAMLQGRLQAVLGADCVTADGVYGPRTRNAVGEFLTRNGLSAATEANAGANSVRQGDGDADGAMLSPSAAAMLRELHLSKLEEHALHDALDKAPVEDQAIAALQPPRVDRCYPPLLAMHMRALVMNSSICQSAPPTQDLKLLQLALRQLMGRDNLVADGKYGPKTRQAIEEFQLVFGMPSEGDISEQLKLVSGVLRSLHKERHAGTQGKQDLDKEVRHSAT